MSGVLDEILASKREEIAAMRNARGRATAMFRAPQSTELRGDELRRRRRDPLRLIAEVKRKSPSAGALSTTLAPADRALVYARAGAAMVSVLCDGPFFDGSFAHLAEVKRAIVESGLTVPVLAKEFVLEAIQIEEALLHGADAVLLIARIVWPEQLRELVRFARAANIEPIVEIKDEAELDTALSTDARVIGVNARDLDTLVVDPERATRVLGAVPSDRIAVHLSGVKDAEDVRRIAGAGADAALVGEALMKLDDPSPLLGEMIAAAR
jgi:indole-3-glycerol phosphate synthase